MLGLELQRTAWHGQHHGRLTACQGSRVLFWRNRNSCRSEHTCAIVNDGVQCWGRNDYGQLGNRTKVDSSTPVQAQGIPSGIIAVAVGGIHTCVIANGAAKCWGGNSHGELGNGTTTDSLSPVQVLGLTAGVTAIVASSQTCAIVNGAVKCWGLNDQAQLGDGTTTDRSTPVTVTGL